MTVSQLNEKFFCNRGEWTQRKEWVVAMGNLNGKCQEQGAAKESEKSYEFNKPIIM